MTARWDESRLRAVEQSAASCPDACSADVVSLVKLAREYRSLLDCAEFALEWLTAYQIVQEGGADWRSTLDGSAFYACDCSEDGGYREYDTNAYIHTERCASGFEDSLGALHDLIRRKLGKD